MEPLSKIQQIVFNKHDLANLLSKSNLEGLLSGEANPHFSEKDLIELKTQLLEIKKSKEKYLKNFRIH